MGESGASAPPILELPERLDRSMALGPFPSVKAALRFAVYASAGVWAATSLGLAWSVPFLGGGFLLTAYQRDGRGLDERLGQVAAFHLRRRSRRRLAEPSAPDPGAFVTSVPGRIVAVLATGGLPVAFLPPNDARGLFERFVQLLRNVDGGLYLHTALEPLPRDPVPRTPLGPLEGSREAAALEGYAEMSRLLCRRRARRVVWTAVWTDTGRDGAALRVDRAAARLSEDLRALGLVPARLRGRRLATVVRRIGWGTEAGA